ncbi:MAG: SUMF1/EgtB/PvdO family nonheme iron enzyme [Planctomycetaceae bacterium]
MEFAARGGSGARYSWREGNPISIRPAVEGKLYPVASDKFDRTPEGVYDLSGNALEWCDDWYYDDTFSRAAEKLDQPLKDFPGPGRSPDGQERVIKGGGDGSSWNRQGVSQSDNNSMIGFRGVLRPNSIDR